MSGNGNQEACFDANMSLTCGSRGGGWDTDFYPDTDRWDTNRWDTNRWDTGGPCDTGDTAGWRHSLHEAKGKKESLERRAEVEFHAAFACSLS